MSDRIIASAIYTGFTAFTLTMLILAGVCLDGIGRYHAERERCLKHATNGYDIERCR